MRHRKTREWMIRYIDDVVGDRVTPHAVRCFRLHFNTYHQNYMPSRGPLFPYYTRLHNRINERAWYLAQMPKEPCPPITSRFYA